MAEFILPIPARIKNISCGGHVAGASDIFDDFLNKEQADINIDTFNNIGKVAAIISMLGISGMSTVSLVENDYYKWVVTDNINNIIIGITSTNKFCIYADLGSTIDALVDALSDIINNS